jgi:hypothetical protein
VKLATHQLVINADADSVFEMFVDPTQFGLWMAEGATLDTRPGALVVKLPGARVHELITSGQAEPFAPAGRTFREWAAIDPDRLEQWPSLLDEALAFVAES